MKYIIPVIVGVIALLGASAIAILNANNLLVGKAWLVPGLYAACAVLLAIAIGTGFVISHREKQVERQRHRPKIVPVRFGYLSTGPQQISGRWYKPTGHAFTTSEILAGKHFVDQGLILRNDGEPAYQISIPEASPVGPSRLVFYGKLSRLDRAQGDAVLTAAIERDGQTIVNGLFDEMRTNSIDSVTVGVEYRGDDDKAWWTTYCVIERDVSVKGGLDTTDFWQKRKRKRNPSV